jgi:phage shock protein C
MSNKRLSKDRMNKSVCGVCAGLAKYLDVDVNLVRIIIVLISLSGGAGIVAYIIAALVLPFEDEIEN